MNQFVFFTNPGIGPWTTEDPLEHQEHMLDFRTDLRLRAITGTLL
jgi:hypothetical protein